MPRYYEKKNLRKQYEEKSLQLAMDAVAAGLSIRESSRQFRVPYTTIHRHVSEQILFDRIGRPTKFTSEEEECLEEAALLLQVKFIGFFHRFHLELLEDVGYTSDHQRVSSFNKNLC